jgi:hypothetical protein
MPAASTLLLLQQCLLAHMLCFTPTAAYLTFTIVSSCLQRLIVTQPLPGPNKLNNTDDFSKATLLLPARSSATHLEKEAASSTVMEVSQVAVSSSSVVLVSALLVPSHGECGCSYQHVPMHQHASAVQLTAYCMHGMRGLCSTCSPTHEPAVCRSPPLAGYAAGSSAAPAGNL